MLGITLRAKQIFVIASLLLLGFPPIISVKIHLIDPPASPPVISLEPTLSLSEPVYQGDNFTVTCTVNGGKPVSATNVSFMCPHMADTTDITGTTMVNSSLRFYSVSPDNQGNCTCSAKWKNTSWYTQTAVWSLIVYSKSVAFMCVSI